MRSWRIGVFSSFGVVAFAGAGVAAEGEEVALHANGEPVTVGNTTQIKTSATQGSVRLKLGEEVQIIRAGTRAARLSIKKLEAARA
jgi:hypothetical protein